MSVTLIMLHNSVYTIAGFCDADMDIVFLLDMSASSTLSPAYKIVLNNFVQQEGFVFTSFKARQRVCCASSFVCHFLMSGLQPKMFEVGCISRSRWLH